MAAQSYVAVLGTTLWNVLTTHVTPQKNVAMLMVLQVAILKVMVSVKLSRNCHINCCLQLSKNCYVHQDVQSVKQSEIGYTSSGESLLDYSY